MRKILAIVLPAAMLAGTLITTTVRAQNDPAIRFCLTGDIMLGRGVKRMSDRYGTGYPFAGTCSLTAGANLTIGNLESPLTSAENQSTSPWHFKGDTITAALELKKAGFDMMSLANNHTLDCGIQGLFDCTGVLDTAGIAYGGLVRTMVDPSGDTVILARPSYLRVKNKKIGLVAFCEPYLLDIAKDHGAVNIAPADSACVARSIAAIRDSCDIIVASFHWGFEYKDLPTWTQKKLGRLAIDCGAKLVHGHHPHVLQGVEFYRDGLIAYSLGNFIFDQKNQVCRESAMLFAELKGDSLTAVSMVPLEIVSNRPVPAGRKKDRDIQARLRQLCWKLGTQVTGSGQNLRLRPAVQGKKGAP
ncbi:CapA family protein [candidate division TA06 bacterium]|nr:CapA family protein [candidate division TA06 bacterium]